MTTIFMRILTLVFVQETNHYFSVIYVCWLLSSSSCVICKLHSRNLRIQYPTILPLKFISLEEGKTYAAAGSSTEPVGFLACEADSSRPQRSRIHSNLRSSGKGKRNMIRASLLRVIWSAQLYLHVVIGMVLAIRVVSNTVVKRHQ